MSVGPVMALVAPPHPVKLAARNPIIRIDKSVRRIVRLLDGVPRGDARFGVSLEALDPNAMAVPA